MLPINPVAEVTAVIWEHFKEQTNKKEILLLTFWILPITLIGYLIDAALEYKRQ